MPTKMRRIIEVYTYYIYTVYILFYFSPSFLLEDTFVSKPSCSALQTTEPRKTSVAFHRWINWSRTDGMDVWKPIFASENLIRAVHHFFHAKKTREKRLQMQLEDFRIFFWTILALRIVTLQKVQRKSLQGNPVVG